MTELIDLTAAAAADGVRAGEIDPTELFELYRARAAGDELNAFTWVADAAPEGPAGGERPLGGVPLAVKDLFCTEGVPSQAGSRILEGYRPPYTATVVHQLQEAGAPLLGKTNQDEFAMGSSNENSGVRTGAQPLGPRSACRVDPRAAAPRPSRPASRRGRSAPIPAARFASPPRCAAIVGLKPTYGACSRYGMIAFASSLDQVGPLTRDVADAALLLRHMIGRDRHDSTSLAFPEPIDCRAPTAFGDCALGVPEELIRRGGACSPASASASRPRSRSPSRSARAS